MYKTETHMHTSEVSSCSLLSAKEMVQRYHEAGFHTLFISDHFTESYFNKLGEMPWEEKTAKFLSGYYEAKKHGDEIGMNVLLSAEFAFKGLPNHYHYLAYGITKEFLDTYPNLPVMTLPEFYEIAKKHNIVVIQSHPFRDRTSVATPQHVDGLEVCNSNPRHTPNDDLAEQTAKVHGLYRTAGSDSHRIEDVAGCGMLSENEIKTVEDFIELLKSGKAEMYRGEK